MSDMANLVRVLTAATGNSTTITLGAAYSSLFMTPTEAGAIDGRTYTWIITDGSNFELVKGAWHSSGNTMDRTTVLYSRSDGTLGTSRISLSGTAIVRIVQSAEDIGGVRGTRTVTGTSDTIANSDLNRPVMYSNASSISVSLAQAGAASQFLDGWSTWVQNLGAGTVTITPTTSTINGASTLVLTQNLGAFVWSDGTNYHSYFVPITEPLLSGSNLSDLGSATTALTNLGGTTVGKALFTASDAAAALSTLAITYSYKGLFYKSNTASVAFTKTGAGTVSLKAGTVIELAGIIYQFSTDTAVQMPTLTAGTDYAIYLCNDGTLRADASFTAATGFTATTSRQIGGFHYAPGGNAAARAGGDATAQINPYSLWDIKFRPSCADPRGMALVAGSFWCDIYLTGVDHHLNGTSKYNVTIADGSSPPKIPASFGGNGSSVYSTFNWWEASEVMQDHGKDLLSYAEFAAAAFGSTEASTSGTDPVSTILRQAYTSKWGMMLISGNMWTWGRDFSYYPGAGTAGWRDVAGARGQVYAANDQGVVAAFFGGYWGELAAICGSRAASWGVVPWSSSGFVGARGRCDHLNHA